MDLKDFKSVQKFANQVKENHSRIDLLFCNVGNIDKPGTLTEDGIESQFQVNYLSGILLVPLFKDRLKGSAELKGSPCQIIFTSSLLYEAGRLLLEFQKPEMLTGTRLHYTTKLCQVTAMMTLEEKFKSEGTAIHCYCVHPGVIPTDFWIHDSFIGRMANKLRKYLRTAESGADEILRPVICSELQNTGGIFLVNGKSRKISCEASSKENQTLLYEKSMSVIKDFLK